MAPDRSTAPFDRPPLSPSAAAHALTLIESEEPELHTNASHPALPGYIIERHIGSGGSGDVFLARRVGSERPVALKLLRSPDTGLTRPDARSSAINRAFRELHLLEDTRISCVPRLLDYGIHEARLFIAVEFIDGRPLDRFCEERDLPLRARVELLARTADAAQLLHERGLIHRDLKPSNILVTSPVPARSTQEHEAQVMLIDLGLATLVADGETPGSTLTEEGRPLGTPAFMAPEQARGDRAAISTRSDVYALGATGYAVLAGSTPHDTGASLADAIRRVAFDQPREPRDLNPTLPRALAAILRKAVSPRPADRYSSAASFATDLRRWARGDHVEAVAPNAWQRATLWASRRPKSATTLACFTIIALSVAGSLVLHWWVSGLPHRIAVYRDAREHRLITRSGNVLKAWESTGSGETSAEFTAAVVAVRDGAWVIAARARCRDDPTGAMWQLAAWDPYQLTSPIWRTSALELSLPDEYATDGRHDDTYKVSSVAVADVFPNRPGEEIIAVHNRAVCPSAIRVYDAATGSVLFEAWHAGSIGSVRWLSHSGLLVLAGLDNTRPQRDADDGIYYPTTIFAIRPTEHGFVSIINRDSLATDSAGVTVWYRHLTPLPAWERLRMTVTLIAPQSERLANDLCSVNVNSPNGRGALSLLVNDRGDIVLRSATDRWADNFPTIPPEAVSLSHRSGNATDGLRSSR